MKLDFSIRVMKSKIAKNLCGGQILSSSYLGHSKKLGKNVYLYECKNNKLYYGFVYETPKEAALKMHGMRGGLSSQDRESFIKTLRNNLLI